MNLEWEQVVIDATDPAGLGQWWAEALGWVVINDSPEEFEIRPSAYRLPGLIFVPVPEAKHAKNRHTWTSGRLISRLKSSVFSARGLAGQMLGRARQCGWS